MRGVLTKVNDHGKCNFKILVETKIANSSDLEDLVQETQTLIAKYEADDLEENIKKLIRYARNSVENEEIEKDQMKRSLGYKALRIFDNKTTHDIEMATVEVTDQSIAE